MRRQNGVQLMGGRTASQRLRMRRSRTRIEAAADASPHIDTTTCAWNGHQMSVCDGWGRPGIVSVQSDSARTTVPFVRRRVRQVTQLTALIRQSKRIVVFTGAGLSTSTGIKDYRSGFNTKLSVGAVSRSVNDTAADWREVALQERIVR
jgi:hypothetical protein